jgi:phosphoribosylamine--glycine ligase
MKLLVIGAGGREHALAWKLAQSPKVQKVFVAPGNGGTALENGLENVALTDFAELIAFAKKEHVHLTVVGPEAPLAAGIVDAFSAAGLKIYGPTRAPALPRRWSMSMASIAASASASVMATTTPLPAARPSALMTIGAPCFST